MFSSASMWRNGLEDTQKYSEELVKKQYYR